GGPALALWLQWRLAEHLGVAAHIHYPLPAGFVWSLARRVLGGMPVEDPLSLERMAWRLFGALPELSKRPGFEEVKAYLDGSEDGAGRFGLARRIADVFDRYLYYRPGWIRAWDKGEGEHWQAQTWRFISEGTTHRVSTLDRLEETLQGARAPSGLPRRVDAFALHATPPRIMDILSGLSRHTELHIWTLSPTSHYWADLVSLKSRAKKRLKEPEAAEHWETGNPLLASWGREGQALQDLMVDKFEPAIEEARDIPPQRTTLLGHIQADIYELRGGEDAPEVWDIPPDHSLQVHPCHGPLRECQVLHDTLLEILEGAPALQPEDILVMVPKIDTYAPYIEAVFGDDAPGRPFLPWHLADVSLADEHPILRVFLQLLDLPESRFTRPEVLSYLDVPQVARAFGFEPDEVDAVRDWIDRARVFWGIDEHHKGGFGIPGTQENTWRQGRDRLFLGFALGEGETFQGIAPIPVEGVLAAGLGKLWELIERLNRWAGVLEAPAQGLDWLGRLNALIEAFFGEEARDPEGHLQRIREACAALAEQAGEQVLDLPLVRHWLKEALARQTRPGRLFQGGVTFCGMLPMRGVPFKVIALLGMNDGDFPRHPSPAEFDEMARRPRHGDPNPGYEDRFLLLETILAARDVLLLFYTGRDVRTNEPIPPSTLLSELLDDLDRRYRIDGRTPREVVVHEHPLQPFSPRNFLEGKGFDPWWCDVARRLIAPSPAPSSR
ncbi:MAG: exodeoxyribonuclease V subunit gamma, partial [Gammaproteobacteria bacterium]